MTTRNVVGRHIGDDVIQQGYLDDRAVKWIFTDVTAQSFTWRGHHLADNGEKWINEVEYRFRRIDPWPLIGLVR